MKLKNKMKMDQTSNKTETMDLIQKINQQQIKTNPNSTSLKTPKAIRRSQSPSSPPKAKFSPDRVPSPQ